MQKRVRMVIEQILLYKKLKAMSDLGKEIQNTVRNAVARNSYYLGVQVFIEGACYASSYEYVSFETIREVVGELADYDGITFEITVRSYKEWDR